MNTRAAKALKNILVEGNTHRIWQIANKSPLTHVFAWAGRQLDSGTFKRRKDALPKNTDPKIQALQKELEQNGYVSVNSILSSALIQEVDTHVQNLHRKSKELESKQVVHTKDFWNRLSDEDLKGGLTTSHPFVKISLQQEILQLVGNYLGHAPWLEYVLLTQSLPSKKPLRSSQLWHRDHDNDRMAKMFIYFTDVNNDDDGPFTFFPRPPSEKIKNSFFDKHLSDAEVSQYIPIDSCTKMTGAKWTAFICDTSKCYHMGSRMAEGHERLMLTSLYITLPAPYPTSGKGKIGITTELSPLQRIAIDQKG